MLKTLGVLTMAAAAIYLAACLWLYLSQGSFVYFPVPGTQVEAPQRLTLEVPGATLKVSARPAPGSQAVLYFGGNAEDVSSSLPILERAFPRHALYLMHYRGYGGSTGTPTESALVQDALALYDRIAREHPEVVTIGRSLGSGIAVQLATRRPVSRLVLVTPYDSIRELAARQFPLFPVGLLLKEKYDSGRHAPQVDAPTLLVAAEQDEIIPAWSTRQLLARFRAGVATMTVIEGAGHNTIADHAAYVTALRGGR